MPRYRYTAHHPAIFTRLTHGVNATIVPGDGRGLPDVCCVELQPGDQLDTDAPGADKHPFLERVDDAEAPTTNSPTADADTTEE